MGASDLSYFIIHSGNATQDQWGDYTVQPLKKEVTESYTLDEIRDYFKDLCGSDGDWADRMEKIGSLDWPAWI